jgi:hypothetical protein
MFIPNWQMYFNVSTQEKTLLYIVFEMRFNVAMLFWESVKMRLTLLKWGLRSPPKLLKLQSSIARVKTLHIGAFFISLESYWRVDVEWACMSHLDICNTSYGKKKGRELIRPWCMQWECNTLLESCKWELQLCFKPRPNWRFEQRIMVLQSCKSPNRDNFGTLLWESWDKKPFECGCHGEAQRILYGGRWWLPLGLGRDESCESNESKIAHGLS